MTDPATSALDDAIIPDAGTRRAVRELSGVAFDVMLGTGILIQAVPLWESEWERPESFNNPSFIEAVKRDGLQLWPH